jgi:putative sterol carrier protein
MSEEMTIDKLMELMPKAFQPEKAGDVAADIQFHFQGDGGGDWIAHIRDGACTTEQGTMEGARLALTSDANDFVQIIRGELNAMSAFAQGKIKLKGDLSLAMKLMDFFKLS